ncbi:conserved hypothetical protein [uncultured Desulfobacterium sp.]|uniref:Nucleotidyl transferase AbiEii/AbiGii toxin family protein n=1 Tax=uncultured Desulfobacterium sp. TaxID=201089 RepID=A0A445N3S3_9BACT|nr:conserved hypothetical protein [uncultured Desulfobacterium sp.]
MDTLRQHELFEIETLEKMNSSKALDPLVFGGGTMLRLCHDLKRYSADLDFWFVKNTPQEEYFDKLRAAFEKDYEITDSQIKHFTLLLELRSASYPKRLKVEIRKEIRDCDYQKTIAFSKFSTKQVILKAHTLEQTMKNKIEAFLEREEIRDCFDMEFLLRRGIDLGITSKDKIIELQKKIGGFKSVDFRVKLGSILEKDIRDYYVDNGFRYLSEKLNSVLITL